MSQNPFWPPGTYQQNNIITIMYYSNNDGLPEWSWQVQINYGMSLAQGKGWTYEDAMSEAACAIIAFFNPPGKRLQYMPVLPKEMQELDET